MTDDTGDILLCHRCGALLTPGEGDFYVARIEAFADPTPPKIRQESFDAGGPMEINEEISNLLAEMKHMSERELMDQVHRRLTLHLCGPCYREWIENPAC